MKTFNGFQSFLGFTLDENQCNVNGNDSPLLQ